jgi:hypothetical protein
MPNTVRHQTDVYLSSQELLLIAIKKGTRSTSSEYVVGNKVASTSKYSYLS